MVCDSLGASPSSKTSAGTSLPLVSAMMGNYRQRPGYTRLGAVVVESRSERLINVCAFGSSGNGGVVAQVDGGGASFVRMLCVGESSGTS